MSPLLSRAPANGSLWSRMLVRERLLWTHPRLTRWVRMALRGVTDSWWAVAARPTPVSKLPFSTLVFYRYSMIPVVLTFDTVLPTRYAMRRM